MSAGLSSLTAGARTLPSVLIAAAISSGIVALLLTFMPWREAALLWRSLSPLGLVAPTAVLALGYAVSSVRSQTMIPQGASVRFLDGVAVSLWHGLAMNVLPARLGELALIEGLRRYAGIGRGGGLAILLLQRIYDLLLTSLAFGLGALGLMLDDPPLVVLVVVAAGLAFVHALPLPTIGGLGVAEGGLAVLLLAAGFQADLAVSLGISVRLTLVALHGVVIGAAFPAIALWKRTAWRAR